MQNRAAGFFRRLITTTYSASYTFCSAFVNYIPIVSAEKRGAHSLVHMVMPQKEAPMARTNCCKDYNTGPVPAD